MITAREALPCPGIFIGHRSNSLPEIARSYCLFLSCHRRDGMRRRRQSERGRRYIADPFRFVVGLQRAPILAYRNSVERIEDPDDESVATWQTGVQRKLRFLWRGC